MCGDVEEMWGDIGEMSGDVGRCGEMRGDFWEKEMWCTRFGLVVYPSRCPSQRVSAVQNNSKL